MSVVKEEDLKFVMEQVKKLRLAVYEKHIDPWATRQGLWIAIEFDTEAARRRGVPEAHLEEFDTLARSNARHVAKQSPW